MNQKLSILYEPFRLKNLELKNRLVMAPMHTKFSLENGEVSDRLTAYLEARARGGIGLIILENTCIDWVYGRPGGNPVTIHDDMCRTGMSGLPLAVHRHGAKIVTQLQHTGRQNVRANIPGGLQPVAPSAVKSKRGGDEPRPLEEHEIERIIQQYVDAARRSREAGFDGVELHGAHGYLLTQFFSPHSNQRTDKWGGSLMNRARFPLEVVRRIRAEVGSDFPILYRMSVEERIPGGTTLEDSLQLVRLLEAVGVDAFDVTVGIYDSIDSIYALQGQVPGALLPMAEAVKRVTTKPVIAVSRLGWDLELAARAVEQGRTDLVTMGRSLLADPDLPRKHFAGAGAEVIPCIACNECIGFMERGWRIQCVVNPQLGSEYLKPVTPALRARRVLVLGGGPAGMQCAVTAAMRGHRVKLVERSSRLGGQLRAAAQVSEKSREIEALIRYFETMLAKHGVEVSLGSSPSVDEAMAFAPDVVVLAIGAEPARPEFPGADRMQLAEDVLLGNSDVPGEHVVVVGGCGVGIDTALRLAEKEGRQVTVVEPGPEMGAELNGFLRRYAHAQADRKGVRFLTHWKPVGLEAGMIRGETLLGPQVLPCDTVVAAGIYRPRETRGLHHELLQRGADVRIAGSAMEAGRIFEATQSGFWIGVEI